MTVKDFIKEIEDYCKKNGLPIPRYEPNGKPMVIIPSKSLEEKFKKHHERQKQKQADQQKNTP